MNRSLAFELFRPNMERYAPIIGALFFVGIFWTAAMNSNDGLPTPYEVTPAAVAPADTATIKAGELDVPMYYFPDAATGTDTYVSVRDLDCGST